MVLLHKKPSHSVTLRIYKLSSALTFSSKLVTFAEETLKKADEMGGELVTG